METKLIWNKGSNWDYALSIASTWIWAPAIFVSSSIAHNNGIYGLLWFLIPNILTLIVFGYITSKYVPNEGINITNAISNSNTYQIQLHKFVSTLLLVMSTLVQLSGISILLSSFGINRNISCIASLLICMLFSINGIKTCIITDKIKYIILLISAIILSISTFSNGTFQGIQGVLVPDFITVATTFGITTCIGLFSAPYVDNTFWQRVFCINKSNRFRVFLLSSIAFGIIPLLFGIMGFFYSGDNTWSLAKIFNNGTLGIVLVIAVLSALFSTIDSNICAMSSLYSKNKESNIIVVISFTAIMCILSLTFNKDIISLFLIYGTIRTCIAIPTLLILFNKFNAIRLNIATTCALVIATLGYYLVDKSYIWLITLLALIIPLLGYKSNKI